MAAKLARFSWLPGGLAAAFVILAGRLLSSTSDAPLELAVYDRVQRAVDIAPSPDMVIVAIDEASTARLGEWPWARDVHATLVDRLRAYGARVVAFTEPLDGSPRTSESERIRAALALLESSNLGDSEQASKLRRLLGGARVGGDPDEHLAAAVRAHGAVIAPVVVGIGEASRDSLDAPSNLRPSATPAALQGAATARIVHRSSNVLLDALSGVGHTGFARDTDGVVRTDVAGVRVGAALVPSLGTVIAARAAGVAPADIAFDGQDLVLGEDVVRIEPELRRRPHFRPASGASFAQIPYWQVAAGEAPAEQLRDKIVLVGFADPRLATDSLIATPTDGETPRVIAVASAAASLMRGPSYEHSTTSVLAEWLACAAVLLLAAFALPALGVGLGAFATALVAALLIVIEVGLLSSAELWVRLAQPAVALIVGYGVFLIGEVVRRTNFKGDEPKDAASLRRLGQTFHKQGQLDLAFETLQRCPLDVPTMDLLYQLGLDFERRRQLPKAAAVYAHIASRDPNYRDLRMRRARVREEEPPARPATRPAPAASPPAREPQRPAVEDYEPEVPARRSSRTLGRYEIDRELGRGAMGVVYLGRDPKINRVVAIKAIPLAEEFEEDDLAEARARFFREAEMAGRLNHPAIVTVYDAGEDQGLAYIAMEYLRGQHLSHFTDASRLLPPRNVMLLAARMAEALHYAHRQNVVHRDIKPANIMFNPDTDELKITDFGIARLTDTSRTKTGIVLGTPSFMSPEQLEGRPLDGRSDQFALGVSLYQLLCGQLPFRAESMPRLMQKIAIETHASVRLVRPELPKCIEPVIDRALAKSADDRYASCGELAVALRECAATMAPARAAEPRHEWLLP